MISVVMTAFNGEKYIKDQLLSLKNQSKKPDEVIIADDGSADSTVDIIREFISEHGLDGWSVKVNEKNLGWRRNFVQAADAAGGDLIFFCDQDDIWMNHKLKVMEEVMNSNADIDVLAGEYIEFTDTVPDAEATEPFEGTDEVRAEKAQADIHLLDTQYPGCSYCVRASFWKRIRAHWNGTFSHDGMSWSSARLLGTLYILRQPVLYWRKHYNSAYTVTCREMKTNSGRVKYFSNEQRDVECLAQIMDDFGAAPEVQSMIERYSRFNQLRIEMLSKHNPFKAFSLLKYLDCYNRKKQFPLEVYVALRRN